MKNTISDQASTNKKLNSLLETWRDDAVPRVINSWDRLTTEEQAKYLGMNNFWCGLHFVVGLSEQANKTLELWEQLVHGGKNTEAAALPFASRKAGESGTSRWRFFP